MVWDSTFEAIKTLENSMRLKLTPQSERRAEKERHVQSEESDHSRHSVETPDKVNIVLSSTCTITSRLLEWSFQSVSCMGQHGTLPGEQIGDGGGERRIYKYTNIQIYKYANIQIYTNIQIFKLYTIIIIISSYINVCGTRADKSPPLINEPFQRATVLDDKLFQKQQQT